eukprot:2884565-Rhodomonas_salina.2
MQVVSWRGPKLWLFVCLIVTQTISFGPWLGRVYGQAVDDYDEVIGRGSQADLAYEQYAERLQQQLESLRKEHDVSLRVTLAGDDRDRAASTVQRAMFREC